MKIRQSYIQKRRFNVIFSLKFFLIKKIVTIKFLNYSNNIYTQTNSKQKGREMECESFTLPKVLKARSDLNNSTYSYTVKR